MGGTFISYRREDSAGYAGRLHETLERRLGQGQIFRDVDTLQPGQDFVRAIEDRVSQCTVFLALIGKEWLDARDAAGRRRLDQEHDFVRLEIASALARTDLLVVPVLVEGASMPSADDLPPTVRKLANRHAISIRDETWDADVERLAARIGNGERVPSAAAGGTAQGARVPRRAPWLIVGATAIALAALAVWFVAQRGRGDNAQSSDDGVTAGSDAAGSGGSTTAGKPDVAPYAIRISRIAEVAHGNLIYTVLSGSVEPRGSVRSLRLRIRASNNGRYDANFWDNSFRLVTKTQTIAPNSGLNQILAGHSIDQAIVTFDIPPATATATLRISMGDLAGEIPLDLYPTGLPPEDERADAGDALSRALVIPLRRDPMPLVSTGALTVELRRAFARRFANTLRLTFSVLLNNRGRYPRASGDVRMRVAFGDRLIPPVEEPSQAIDGNANVLGDYVFDAPPPIREFVLRVTVGGTSAEMPFELPTPGGQRGRGQAPR